MMAVQAVRLRIEVRTVTPEQAEAWLGRNDKNRNLRPSVVERYGRDMEGGAWRLDGQTIKFTEEGRLIDGQHRLAACILTGASFPTAVAWGVDPGSMETIDTGLARKLGDLLRLRDETDVFSLASAIRCGWTWDTGGYVQNTKRKPTNFEALQWLDANPGIRDMVRRTHKIRDMLRCSTGVVAAFALRAGEAVPEEIDAFLNAIYDGAELASGDPRLTLRNFYLRAHARAHVRIDERAQMGAFIKAWNAWLRGQTPGTVALKLGGSHPERFPVLAGWDEL